MNGLSFSFSEVRAYDVGYFALRFRLDGSGEGYTFDAGAWTQDFADSSQMVGGHIVLMADQTDHTFTLTHQAPGSEELIAVLLRSTVTPNRMPDFVGYGDPPSLTTTPDEAVLRYSGSYDGYGSFTGDGPHVLVANLAHIALWAHDPLQVPMGTDVGVTATGDTNSLVGVGVWVWGFETAPPVGGGGWSAWVVD